MNSKHAVFKRNLASTKKLKQASEKREGTEGCRTLCNFMEKKN